MTKDQIIEEVLSELKRAKKKFPVFPNDIVHAAAIVGEEAGELLQASLENYYENGSRIKAIKEAYHTTAMGLRFLFNFCDTESIQEAADAEKETNK